VVNHEVNKAGLVDILGDTNHINTQGEEQQKLDIYAHKIFIQTLTNRNIVCGIASEEEEHFIQVNSMDKKNQNKYIVLIDPLDGSSNIDVNVSVGTIFSIYRRWTPLGTPVIDSRLFASRRSAGGGRICDLWHLNHVGLYYWKWSEWLYLKSSIRHILFVASQYDLSEKWIYLFYQ